MVTIKTICSHRDGHQTNVTKETGGQTVKITYEYVSKVINRMNEDGSKPVDKSLSTSKETKSCSSIEEMDLSPGNCNKLRFYQPYKTGLYFTDTHFRVGNWN